MAQGHARHHPRESPAAGQGNQHHQEDVGNPHHQVDTPGDAPRPPGGPAGRRPIPMDQGDHRADRGGENPNPDAQGQAGQTSGPAYPGPSSPCRRDIAGRAPGSFCEKSVCHRPALQEYPRNRHRAVGARRQMQKRSSACLPAVAIAFMTAPPPFGSWGPPRHRAGRQPDCPRKTMAAVTTVMPSSRGRSLPSPASTAACPRPG